MHVHGGVFFLLYSASYVYACMHTYTDAPTFCLLPNGADNVADSYQHLAKQLVGAVHPANSWFAAIKVLTHLLAIRNHQAPSVCVQMAFVIQVTACGHVWY